MHFAFEFEFEFEWVYKLELPYHRILWASKRSLKVGKCVGLLDVLDKLYKYQPQCLYSRLILVSYIDILLINFSDSESEYI